MRTRGLRSLRLCTLLVCSLVASAAQAQSAPDAAQRLVNQRAAALYLHEYETGLKRLERDELRDENRNFVAPLVASGVGVAALIIGGIVFASAWTGEDGYNVARDRTGLIMMPLGALHVIVGVPMFALRLRRANKLARIERALSAPPGVLSVAPAASRERAGLRLQLTF